MEYKSIQGDFCLLANSPLTILAKYHPSFTVPLKPSSFTLYLYILRNKRSRQVGTLVAANCCKYNQRGAVISERDSRWKILTKVFDLVLSICYLLIYISICCWPFNPDSVFCYC